MRSISNLLLLIRVHVYLGLLLQDEKEPCGFERGLEPERVLGVLGATHGSGGLKYLMKWYLIDLNTLAPAIL